MWIYLIDVGGDEQCWKGETVQDAMSEAIKSYCTEVKELGLEQSDDSPEAQWHRTFRSCKRIGMLGNP